MAFQFQSVATVAPLLSRDLAVAFADIGLLIGLYLAPGAALALPGGAIGRRFGDKAAVLAGLALMIAGGLVMALSPLWSAQIGGRLLAGSGGVLLNVLMSKMVTDWFAGREIATAMAIFVNSWPAGIAVALLVLPPIGAAYGVSAAFLAAVVLVAIGMIMLAALYKHPPLSTVGSSTKVRPDRLTMSAVLIAGLIWSLYNTAFAMIFSFGPSMLVERGWPITAAGSTVSLVLWLAVLPVPFGGFLADRTKRADAILVVSCLVFAALMVVASRTTRPFPPLSPSVSSAGFRRALS
jgi:MFS family permease